MARQRSGGQTDWKDKYLTALEDQEKQEKLQQQLAALLMRAVTRISLVADGYDRQLDKQLAGLRQLLRDGKPSRRDLTTVVDALEGQVKRVDDVKAERQRSIAQSFETLASQLQALGPDRDVKHLLKQLRKTLKQRSGRIDEYASLLKELAHVQQSILQDAGSLRVSKPFWHSWTDDGDSAAVKNKAVVKKSQPESQSPVSDDAESETTESPNQQVAEQAVPTTSPVAPVASLSTDSSSLESSVGTEGEVDGLDLADDIISPEEAIDPATVGKEPPFSRLNQAVCATLTELLEQIECPPMARANYQSAQKQLAKGLNWYELVPTLEDISIVVVSAFDNSQRDFESFLSQLNSRLGEVYTFIDASQDAHQDGAKANRELRASMEQQVSAMRTSVAEAQELNQLKQEVNQRLELIVSAMDKHASGEQERELSLTEQLNALVERVKSMEVESANAEKRIEEQRQLALLDVLTQLPNREAYQQRLEHEFDRWQRYRRPLTLVVCDVDHFKRINDSYGHLAGDKVLRIIAKTLKKRLRKTDFIARFGGEEFVILLPETESDAGLRVVEGVREAIASCPFHFKEKPVQITTSFGVTAFREGDNAELAFERADRALYQAKERRRNCCVLDSESFDKTVNKTSAKNPVD